MLRQGFLDHVVKSALGAFFSLVGKELDVQGINGVQESPLRMITAPKMLVFQCFGAMRGGGEIHD